MKQISDRSSRCAGGGRARARFVVGRGGHATILLAAIGALVLGACDLGTPTSRIQGVTQAAPQLEEYNDRGDYTPYYSTAELNTPRYLHEAVLSTNGLVYVFGGSDERGLASLDTVEIFDQSTFAKDQLAPDSLAGIWVDTNFEGDPIVFQSGPRMLMTVDELSNNTMVIIGGTTNLLASAAIGKVEIFDPDAREFSVLESEMLEARFRHTTVPISGGDLMVVGGQIQSTITVIDENVQEGQPGREQQVTVFPSTNTVELFSPKDLDFRELLPVNSSVPVTLQTQRGRAGHAMERIAGPDNRLNNSDDLYIIAGGFQTLSAISGQAPQDKSPGAVGRGEADGLTTIEVFDPQANLFTLIASVKLNGARIHTPEAVNLGKYNDFTPDGVRGMGNAVLITLGNDDAGTNPAAAIPDQLFVANYTPGAGPAQGIRFFEVEEERFFSYIQNTEYQQEVDPIARSGTNTVSLPRPYITAPGVDDEVTWVFSLCGVSFATGVADYDSPGMLSGHVFDPFFSLRAAFVFNLEPTDLANERRSEPFNFLGVVGVWMNIDGNLTTAIEDFGTTPSARWASNNGGARIFHRCVPVPGVDGIPNTYDDRILICGGGKDYGSNGGEPTSPSAEVFLPPGASEQ